MTVSIPACHPQINLHGVWGGGFRQRLKQNQNPIGGSRTPPLSALLPVSEPVCIPCLVWRGVVSESGGNAVASSQVWWVTPAELLADGCHGNEARNGWDWRQQPTGLLPGAPAVTPLFAPSNTV